MKSLTIFESNGQNLIDVASDYLYGIVGDCGFEYDHTTAMATILYMNQFLGYNIGTYETDEFLMSIQDDMMDIYAKMSAYLISDVSKDTVTITHKGNEEKSFQVVSFVKHKIAPDSKIMRMSDIGRQISRCLGDVIIVENKLTGVKYLIHPDISSAPVPFTENECLEIKARIADAIYERFISETSVHDISKWTKLFNLIKEANGRTYDTKSISIIVEYLKLINVLPSSFTLSSSYGELLRNVDMRDLVRYADGARLLHFSGLYNGRPANYGRSYKEEFQYRNDEHEFLMDFWEQNPGLLVVSGSNNFPNEEHLFLDVSLLPEARRMWTEINDEYIEWSQR